MQDREWREIFNGINFQGLSHENVIDRIKRTLNRKHPKIYKEWEKKQFDIDHLFLSQDNHIHNKCTLLHISACCGLGNIVRVLLKTGAEVNAVDHRYNKPSLHRLCEPKF